MNVFGKNKRDKFKLKYSGITDKDLEYTEGDETKMLIKLGDKLGKTKIEMLRIIIGF